MEFGLFIPDAVEGLRRNDVSSSSTSTASGPSDLVPHVDESLLSVLSARNYPLPSFDGPFQEGTTNEELTFLSFGFGVAESDSQTNPPTDADIFQDQPSATRSTDGASDDSPAVAASVKPNLKKRKNEDESPKERRKKQIREAQRAYRLRKESRISFLTNRVSQLEQVIEDMSEAITTYSDSLLQSGVLAPHPNLVQRTRDTLETCLSLTKSLNTEDDEPKAQQSNTQLSKSSNDNRPPSSINVMQLPRLELSPQYSLQYLVPPPPSILSNSPSSEIMPLKCSVFMDELHKAVLYSAYIMAADPKISSDSVRQKFRLLFPTMDRSRLAAYFAAALHAKVTRNDIPKEWQSIPFFQLGGAGTHYSWPAERGPYTRRSRLWHAVPVPLSGFSADIQEVLGGDWFDMQDLECFLLEKDVKLIDAPTLAHNDGKEPQKKINATKLIADLVNTCFCLGRSAGFRRTNVEAALTKAVLL